MNRILVRRQAALGNVLCITPAVRRLHRENPEAIIDVETHYVDVFAGNPDINQAVRRATGTYDCVLDLNMVQENNTRIFEVDANFEAIFGDRGRASEKTIIFRIDEPPDLPINLANTVVLHANVSWPNRTLPGALWQGLADRLQATGRTVLVTGTAIDQTVTGPSVLDLRGRLNLHQQAAVFARAECYVGGPSGLFFTAAASDVPIVTFMTINRPETAMFYRHGVQGWNSQVLVAAIPCMGCSENKRGVTYIGCDRNDSACVQTFTADQAYAAVIRAISQDLRSPG